MKIVNWNNTNVLLLNMPPKSNVKKGGKKGRRGAKKYQTDDAPKRVIPLDPEDSDLCYAVVVGERGNRNFAVMTVDDDSKTFIASLSNGKAKGSKSVGRVRRNALIGIQMLIGGKDGKDKAWIIAMYSSREASQLVKLGVIPNNWHRHCTGRIDEINDEEYGFEFNHSESKKDKKKIDGIEHLMPPSTSDEEAEDEKVADAGEETEDDGYTTPPPSKGPKKTPRAPRKPFLQVTDEELDNFMPMTEDGKIDIDAI